MGAPTTAGAADAATTQFHVTPLGNRGCPTTNHSATATQQESSLEEIYTSLIQEYLQVMCLDNATFLAERMVASCRSIHAWYLLGVCHYRSNAPQRALSVLEHNGGFLKEHPPTAYLMAQCCFQLQQYGRAEEVLLQTARSDYREYKANYNHLNNLQQQQQGNDNINNLNEPMTMDEWMVEHSPCPVPNGAAGLNLLGNVCRRSNRKRRAMEYYRMSLQLDPLMWVSYEALCEMGAVDIDPTTIFGVLPSEIDQLQERFQQRNLAHDEMPLREKSVLTPHHFTPPTHGAGVGVPSTSRPMDVGTPASVASIGPKASLFQTAQKSSATVEPGSAAILPNHLQFDTPNLTPIPMQQDASFIRHQHSRHPASAARVTFQQSSVMSEADIPLNHVFGDSINPHTIRRAKHVAARLYYQPSPETRPYDGIPESGRRLDVSRGVSSRGFLRGRSALRSAATTRIDFEPTVSETPVRRGGRPSDISTARRPRALFLSEHKAMRENTNDLNQTNSSTLENDSDDDENNFRPVISRGRDGGETEDRGMDAENHPDDEQRNMMMTDDHAPTGANATQQPSLLAEDEKLDSFANSHNRIDGDPAEEEAMIEKQGSVQEILELLCLLGAGYWRLCQFRCREALQLFSSLPQVHHNTGWVLHQEGRTYFEMADYQSAQVCLDMMQRVEPHRMKGLDLLSTVLWQLKKEVDLAHLAQRAVDFDRLSPEAWCVVGNCFSLQKEHETALVFFGRSLQLDPSFTYTHTLSGYEYMANEDFDKAMACFRNGIRSDDRHYNAWYGMGAIYHRQEKYDLAEYHFHRAVQINPQSSVLRCNLGMSQYSNGKSLQALNTLSEAFRLDPHNPQARFQRATIYLSLNRPEEALEELQKVRDAAPREATVHFAMGKVLKRLGRPEQAMRCFLTALDLDPKDNQLIKSAMDKLEEPDTLDEEVTAF